MKTENLFLVGIAAIVGYKLFAGNQQKLSFLPDTLFEQDTSVQTPSTTTTTSTPTTASFPLKRGSKGDYVKKLQQYLGVTADGIFGPVTESALYQRHGIKQVDSLAKLTSLLATAAQAQKPAQTTTSTPVTTNNTPATITVSDAEYVAVFNAVYEKVTMGGQPVIRVRSVIDVDGILNVLGKKTDAQLKAWNAEFNRRYAKILIWQNYSTPTTLYNTLDHISFIRRSVTVSALIKRVKALI